MKKEFISLFCFLLFNFNIFAETPVIKMRTDLWCPYACDPKSDKPGYMVEIVKEAFRSSGINVEYNVMNWARSISDTKAGFYDAVVGASRSDVPGFILPKKAIGKNFNHYFVLKEDAWNYKNSNSLTNKKVGVITDYAYGAEIDNLLAKNHPSFTKISGENPLERLVKMTQLKRLDAFVENPMVLKLKLEELKLPLDMFKKSSKNLSDDSDLFVAFSPKNPKAKEYAEIIDKEFVKMKKDGRLKKILSKYNVEMWK